MNYGFSYKGSKNKLAEKIVKLFPDAENFYDLFCGGCAVTHRALIENRWKNFIANDVDSRCTDLFLDAVHGKFKNETRWISREDFYNLRDKDGYIAFLWSFGNNGKKYLYGKEIEPYKKALHYAICFNDYSLGKKLGLDFSLVDDVQGLHERRLFLQKYLKETKTGLNTILKTSIECSAIIQNLARLQSLERLEIFNCSYQQLKIKRNSVIYCDIPYEKTDKYVLEAFNHKDFFKWALEQEELVFISSYEMPEEFISIAEFPHRCTLSSRNHKAVTEKVFIPKHQLDLYKQKMTS